MPRGLHLSMEKILIDKDAQNTYYAIFIPTFFP